MSKPKPGTARWNATLDRSDAEVSDLGEEYRRRFEKGKPPTPQSQAKRQSGGAR